MTSRISTCVVLVSAVLVAWPGRSVGDVSGKTPPSRRYVGELELGGMKRGLRVEIEIDKIAFRLTSFHGYNLVRVRVMNESNNTPVDFSDADDKFSMELPNGNSIAGILNLAQKDPKRWDALDKDMRKAIAYPASVEKNDSRYFYVAFQAETWTELPESFRFEIKSLGKSIEIKTPPRTRA